MPQMVDVNFIFNLLLTKNIVIRAVKKAFDKCLTAQGNPL